MGLFNRAIRNAYAPNQPLSAPALASPFSSSDSLETALVTDFFGEVPDEVVTPEIALRVSEVSRALQAHQAMVASLKFEVYRDGVKADVQPFWVGNSGIFGISPHVRMMGVVQDLFLFGQALLGATLGADDLPQDLLHIPRAMWTVEADGSITVDEGIPSAYRQRLIWVPLGMNGVMVNAIDSIRKARKLELAQQNRLDTPPPATELHITDTSRDEMTKKEREALAKSYAESRRKHATAVTPSYLQVIDHNGEKVDLFESAANSIRIQLAGHAQVPASFLEAGKEGGSNGQLSYSNTNDKNSELFLFGSSFYLRAIEGRLSMDDVVGPGAEVRADLTPITTIPAPSVNDPNEG